MIKKDSEVEQPIPNEWKDALYEIVEDIRNCRLQSREVTGGSYVVDPADADRIYENIDAYGEKLARLHEESWDTSICRWMTTYWYILIDLFTVDEGASDLVLVVNGHEVERSYRFDVQSVHVP